MKKVLSVFIAAALFAVTAVSVFADDSANPRFLIKETDNGKVITYPSGYSEPLADDYRFLIIDGVIAEGAQVLIQNSRTLVPARLITEKLGCVVGWDEKKKEIVITKGIDSVVSLKIGGKTAKVNGRDVKLDTPPVSVNGTTYVPLTTIADCIGVTAGYYAPKKPKEGSFFDGHAVIWVESVSPLETYVKSGNERTDDVKATLRRALAQFGAARGIDVNFEQLQNTRIDNLQPVGDAGHYYVLEYYNGATYNTELLVDKYTGSAYYDNKTKADYRINPLTMNFFADMMR
ncbi:hypothetical protein AGMMS49975_04360 [Clostridia bacterium]|nr:hypothetical protein AGMMS49975_04360 [Clostridia bacterium]GHU77213.1 hypothetical protein FACS1894188_11060 [Clostridia bacterium]